MENQRYTDLVKCIISSKQGLNPSKPVHLFGAGHPIIFPLAVALGCDLFDSSAYVKYAQDRRMIFSDGTEKLDDLKELPCCCPVCSEYSISELKKLSSKDITFELAKHNLYISFAEIKKIRTAILEGNLWELVERRASSNPYLLTALKELTKKDYKDWLEKFEPVSKKKALFYTGNHTIHRPIIYRIHNRLIDRFRTITKNIVIIPEVQKPFSRYYDTKIPYKKNIDFVVNSHIGPIPLCLDEMYPFAQSVFPDNLDIETEDELRKVFDEFTKNKKIIFWDGKGILKELSKYSNRKTTDIDIRRISAVLDMQFGCDTSGILIDGDVKIIKSRKTGKIRNIFCNGQHILSMRASDGLFTLKLDGGYKLKKLKYPKLRVVVEDDAVSFIKDGKSVFAKFVKDCDPELRPLDECIIVDRKDNLLAVGRCLMIREEMLSFNYGIAVKTRESIG
jgi:7-cyano-7-deazaguanine tRNA-ribosyltransferase